MNNKKSISYLSLKKGLMILFLLFQISIFAQFNPTKREVYKEKTIQNIGVRAGYGVIIPHRESMIHLITGHVSSIEIFSEHAGTRRTWNQFYSYPTSGVVFYTAFLGNPNVLGNAFALDYYSNLHLIKKSKQTNKEHAFFLFDMRLSTGFGFLTKTFDPDINNHNVAIGSKINVSVGLSFDFKWRLKNATQIITGFSLRHFSNGSYTTPNLGINIPYINIGIKKNLDNHFYGKYREYVILDSTRHGFNKKIHQKYHDFILLAGIGTKEIYPAGGNKYGTYSLEASYTFHHSYRSALMTGFDIIHNVALYKHSIRFDSTFNGTQKDITQYAINIGYAQVFDKFELFLQSGIYLISKAKKDGLHYQRLGGRYIFNERWVAQFALKTHFAKADYFEIGVGYNIRKKRQLTIDN